MFPTKFASESKVLEVKKNEANQENRDGARVYQTPDLLVVGKAVELVQGGGGNYADNNRSRQY